MAYDYLGKSFKYPFQPNTKAQVAKVEGTDAIKLSIFVILSTPIGSYFFIEEFGSNLYKRRFEPNDRVLESLLRFDVLESLSRWEKRVKILDISFSDVSEAQKNIIIYFALKQRNEIDSFVYPFYRELIA